MNYYMPCTLCLFLLVAVASVTAQETLVPLDSAGKLYRIDRELEQKIGLFPDVSDFKEARLYGLMDSSFILEITILSTSDGIETRQRRLLTSSDAATFRASVTRKLSVQSPATILDQEGRVRLIVGTTALGLSYYGYAVPTALAIDDSKAFLATYMLTAAAGFFVPYLATANAEVSIAQADLSTYGFLFGIGHGVLLYALSGDDFDIGDATPLLVGVLAGITEGITGYYIARDNKLSEGKVGVLTGMGTFGLGFGAGAAYVAGAEDMQPLAAGALLGTVGGFFAGNAIADAQHFTGGDARVFLTATALVAAAPPLVMMIGGSSLEDGRVPVATAILGAAGGIVLGNILVRDHEFSSAQGSYIALGTAGGTLLGLGTAYLLSSDSNADGTIYGAAMLVGSVGGFALMYNALEDDARVKPEGTGWDFQISPMGIGAILLNGRPSSASISIPVASIRYTF